MTVDDRRDGDGGARSTLEFIVEWAEERTGGRHLRAGTTLTPPEAAAVARRAACLLGDRALRDVTLGDLARLPILLEEEGMAPERARSACREIGCALRSAIGGWGQPGDAAEAASCGRR